MDCRKRVKNFRRFIKNDHICAGNINTCQVQVTKSVTKWVFCGGNDAYSGDSGGPLLCDVDGTAVLAGIVSFGFTQYCGQVGYPGGYSRLSPNYDWLMDKLDNEYIETTTTATTATTTTTTTKRSTAPHIALFRAR